jgi:ADP-dependent NAD(P)H-hydrate dehydratase
MPRSQRSSTRAREISRALLRRWPLPSPESAGDKDDRGIVLVVGGAKGLPGAVVLAGVAALRSGAGKLQIASCESSIAEIGVTVPEALVVGLSETNEGTISAQAAGSVTDYANKAAATLIGPGMRHDAECNHFVHDLLSALHNTTVILDAGALASLSSDPAATHRLDGRVVLTPHAGEMAALSGIDSDSVEKEPAALALEVAQSLDAVVALKGATTHVASPTGEIYRYDGGDIGLATSGSGDTLAGVVAGLIARGASPLQATVWGVYVHGAAGNVLARTVGRVGFLARELLDEIPGVMRRL